MPEFLTYRTFETVEEAQGLINFLEENGIATKIYKAKQLLDHTIIGEDYDNKVELKIHDEDFKRANQLLDERILKNIDSVEHDHYLYSFTEPELLEVIKKPDEWSRQDVIIAKHILEQTGKVIPAHHSTSIVKEESYIPENVQPSWLFIGYALSFFGLMGFFSGFSLVIAKKVLPDGRKVSMYSGSSRTHGKVIILISFLSIVLSFFLDKFLILNLFGFFHFLF